MDDGTEDVIAADGLTVAGPCGPSGHSETEAAVRSGPVVIAHVLAKHRLELTPTCDEELVEAVLSGCPHPTLGERVCDRRFHRGAHDFDAG